MTNENPELTLHRHRRSRFDHPAPKSSVNMMGGPLDTGYRAGKIGFDFDRLIRGACWRGRHAENREIDTQTKVLKQSCAVV